MGRKFSFFDWARGNPSKAGNDFRRLLILLGCVIGVIGLIVVIRMVFWKDKLNGEHPHEKGPHGGMLIAIDKEEPHYHAEVLVEEDGRIHLFLSGEHAENVVEVSHQLLIAQVKRHGEDRSTSQILRPAGKPGATEKKTSHFIGRFSPGLMESRLSVWISKLEIHGREFPFQFELPSRHDGKKRAAELEKALVLAPKGKYTRADVEAAEKQPPSEKYAGINVVHDLRAKMGDSLCPVSRAKADPRIRWQVSGKIYQFCCPPCVVEFIGAAQDSSEVLIAPEDLVQKN